MPSTPGWFWYSTNTWPGFTAGNQNNLGSNGNTLAVNPSGYEDIVWNDANSDGVISDADTGDGSTTNGDTITLNGLNVGVKEVARYTGSTMTHDGTTYTVPMVVWLFNDGTFAIRINDADIPAGSHIDVTALQLGTWDRTEYSGTFITTRDDAFLCFAARALIMTDLGERAVESLTPGCRVLTADHGYQPLRWIGRRSVTGHGAAAPVRFAAGAMGNARDLYVSQQHRMLLRGWQAELIAGAEEVLVAARHLVNGTTITLHHCAEVTYVHLLFDRHEIVFAEGIGSESFHPGAWGLEVLDLAARNEVLTLFPELADRPAAYGPSARPCIKAHEGRAVAA